MDELFVKLQGLQKQAQFYCIPAIVLVIFIFWAFLNGDVIWGLIFIAALILFAICGTRALNEYKTLYKQNVVNAALHNVFTDVYFEPREGISEQTVRNTGMMYTGDRFTSNDLITGKYNGVDFIQSDVHIETKHTDSKGHTTYTTIFKGRWMIFEFNKQFSCDLQVVSKFFGAAKRKGGIFSKKEDKLHKVELENDAFNKKFKVYSQSEHEAFYVLTPHIMEAILKLEAGCKGKIMLMFVGGALHIAVNNGKDAFEPPLFKKLEPEREQAAIVGDIRLITDFVDELRLDNDIYKNYKT